MSPPSIDNWWSSDSYETSTNSLCLWQARKAAGVSLFTRPVPHRPLGELVEGALLQTPISEVLDAVRESPLSGITSAQAQTVVRRVLRDEAEVTPFEVAAFGSHI